jgi:hypothetical protein
VSQAEVGIDAGAYARLLMKNCARFAEGEEVISQASPLRILKQAYLGTKVQGKYLIPSPFTFFTCLASVNYHLATRAAYKHRIH